MSWECKDHLAGVGGTEGEGRGESGEENIQQYSFVSNPTTPHGWELGPGVMTGRGLRASLPSAPSLRDLR